MRRYSQLRSLLDRWDVNEWCEPTTRHNRSSWDLRKSRLQVKRKDFCPVDTSRIDLRLVRRGFTKTAFCTIQIDTSKLRRQDRQPSTPTGSQQLRSNSCKFQALLPPYQYSRQLNMEWHRYSKVSPRMRQSQSRPLARTPKWNQRYSWLLCRLRKHRQKQSWHEKLSCQLQPAFWGPRVWCVDLWNSSPPKYLQYRQSTHQMNNKV